MHLINQDTTDVSQEGKAVDSSIVKAMQLVIINQKDQTITQIIWKLENRVTQLENQLDDIKQY